MAMQRFRQIGFSESGTAMVETAFILPIMIALLLGAVEMGDLAYKSNEITNAARSAAQFASSTGGAYTDCDGTVPDHATPTFASANTCSTTRGVYKTAQKDAPLVFKSCNSIAVKEATTCICSDGTACTSSATSGYTCGAKPVITVNVYTSASCPAAANVPNLFPVGTAFTLTGFSAQEVTE